MKQFHKKDEFSVEVVETEDEVDEEVTTSTDLARPKAKQRKVREDIADRFQHEWNTGRKNGRGWSKLKVVRYDRCTFCIKHKKMTFSREPLELENLN